MPFVYEDRVKVLPTFPVVVAQPGFWARDLDTGIDWVKVVHGEHDLVLHKLLPPSGTVTSKTRVLEVDRQGTGQGRADLFAAQGAGQGERRASGHDHADQLLPRRRRLRRAAEAAPEPHPLPERAPDVVCDLPTRPEMALLYRWNADMNPLHADPAIAKAAGFPRPILHGLAHLRRCPAMRS